MRLACVALTAALIQAVEVAGYVPPLATSCKLTVRESCSLPTSLRMGASGAQRAVARTRREALVGVGLGLATTLLPQPALATPVRAPLPPGPADPADWESLTKAAGTVEAWGSDLEDPDSWTGIAEQVKKEPFTQESMDLMFRKAAKNLPPNALLGSDAGYWAGVRVEVFLCWCE